MRVYFKDPIRLLVIFHFSYFVIQSIILGKALEVIPRTLIQNCGGSSIRQLTALRAKHAQSPAENWTWGINGNNGELVDVKELDVWDPLSVRRVVYYL